MVDYGATFEESLARVSNGELTDEFVDRFYERFMTSHPAVPQKFSRTDMKHQRQMLKQSFAEMHEFFRTHETNPYLVTLARIHGVRGHDVGGSLYDLWLDALVQTVRELDPKADDNVELAWRIVMAPGIEFMKFYRDK